MIKYLKNDNFVELCCRFPNLFPKWRKKEEIDILKVINISEGMVNMTDLEISLKEDLLFKKIFSNQEELEK